MYIHMIIILDLFQHPFNNQYYTYMYIHVSVCEYYRSIGSDVVFGQLKPSDFLYNRRKLRINKETP